MGEQHSKPVKLTQAIEFALDFHEAMAEKGACMRNFVIAAQTIEELLPKYPGCVVTGVITFADASVAVFALDGISVK